MYYKLTLLNLILFIGAISAMEDAKSKLDIHIEELTGVEARKYHKQLAANSIKNFAEFPYLYKGSQSYERGFLGKYYKSSSSKFVVAFDALQRVVGFSISSPLQEESDEIRMAYVAAGRDLAKYLYLVEVCISPEYRGSGVFREMLQKHERYGQSKGLGYGAFIIIDRPGQAVRVAEIAKHKFGGQKIEGCDVQWSWTSAVSGKEESHQLSVWEKRISK